MNGAANSEIELLDQAIELIEKANANIQPELIAHQYAHDLVDRYARIEKLGGFGITALADKVNDVTQIAKARGTSLGDAKDALATSKVMASTPDLRDALQHGDISFDQATEIAKAEESAPGAATELVQMAQQSSFHVLREQARRVKLDAEQHRNLAVRQRGARMARSYGDELGMVHIHMALEPHVGSPLVARAEAEAQRLFKKAKKESSAESFDKYLADAWVQMLSGNGKGPASRPELVVLVSHEVAQRGWTEVRDGEVCKIPGVGPIAPETAQEIGTDAFINGVVFDGTDLREFKRWTKHITVEVRVALELGKPPDFDGIKCTDCGNRFRTEIDHVHPRAAKGPTSLPNNEPRCWPCHQTKTAEDRRKGLLRPGVP